MKRKKTPARRNNVRRLAILKETKEIKETMRSKEEPRKQKTKRNKEIQETKKTAARMHLLCRAAFPQELKNQKGQCIAPKGR